MAITAQAFGERLARLRARAEARDDDDQVALLDLLRDLLIEPSEDSPDSPEPPAE